MRRVYFAMSNAVLMVAMLSGVTLTAQSAPLRKTYQLWNFDEQGFSCHLQKQWPCAWNKNKDRIYWDDTARCFRVSSAAKPK
jgi:hypothetical protein